MAYDFPTNFSNGTQVTGLGSFFQYGDYIIGGIFAEGILFFIFAFSFVIGMASGTRKALLASSFITFVFAIFFARLDMLNPIWIFVLIVVGIIGAIGSKEERGL